MAYENEKHESPWALTAPEDQTEAEPAFAPAQEPAPALTAVSAKKQAPRLEPPAPEPEEEAPAPDERIFVCDVQFRAGSKIYFFDPGNLNVKNGDHVIVDTTRGAEFGTCIIGNHRVARRELVQPLRRVLRLATPIDERIRTENEKKEKDAFAFCLRKIGELGLDMQLVSVECAFDGSKLLFFFTADARVDFRELVKILAACFHTRIELRQIGVRDKAKMLGGLGICGRPFCCASFLEDFQPVSIKMAKTQNLSLNPTKISGTCGRLMCCLKYEQEAYEDLIKNSPKLESFVDTPDGRGTVTGVNLMRQSVNVCMEQDEDEVHTYRNSDICVLRSGKAKKNDPPIPSDLAPISGRKDCSLLRERRPFFDQRVTVDPEEVFEQVEQTDLAPDSPPQEARPARRNRRDRRDTPAEQGERAVEKPVQEKKPARRQSAPPADRINEASRARKSNRGERDTDQVKRIEKPQRTEKPERFDRPDRSENASRSQRRRQHQGKPELKLPQAEPAKHPAPEKRPEDQNAPKPEGKKNNKRRYYHNRKPKG